MTALNQALLNYLARFLPQDEAQSVGRDKAELIAKTLSLESIIKCKFSGAHNIDSSDNEETNVYKRNMYNFIVANKEDSGHLVLEDKREYMMSKYQILELMFEHTTDEIYDIATKERVAKLVNFPTRSYLPRSGSTRELGEQNQSIIQLREQAQFLDQECGGDKHN